MSFQHRVRRGLGVVYAVCAEIEIRKIVVQLGGVGIGIERQLILLDGLIHLIRAPLGNSIILVHTGKGQVKVRLSAVWFGRVRGVRRRYYRFRPCIHRSRLDGCNARRRLFVLRWAG